MIRACRRKAKGEQTTLIANPHLVAHFIQERATTVVHREKLDQQNTANGTLTKL